MEGKKQMRRLGNKGFSFIELLVAMAVGSIVISALVALLTQGLKGYSRQTLTAQLQDEATIALNQISDAIMTADCIEVERNASGDVVRFVTKKNLGTDGNTYIYDVDKKVIMVGKFSGDAESSTMCKYVEKFDVTPTNSSISILDDGSTAGVKIYDEYQLQVTLTLRMEDVTTKELVRVTNVRNQLKFDDVKYVGP